MTTGISLMSGMKVRSLVMLALAAATAATPTARVRAAGPDPLFRSTGPEVRLRCGSEVLRAKLRGGRLVVQTASGERAILVPVAAPRAVPQGQAYGDGRLTLYKLKDLQVWALARTGEAGEPARCTPERRTP